MFITPVRLLRTASIITVVAIIVAIIALITTIVQLSPWLRHTSTLQIYGLMRDSGDF
jgi:hypothetical protein